MRELFVAPFKSLIRITAQVRKELIQVRRRPGAVISLVFGPFLIMAVFGLGFTGVHRPLDTLLVIPANLPVPQDAGYYADIAGPGLNLIGVTDDADGARAQLEAHQVDLVVVAPADATERLQAGQQAQIQVYINEVDPVAVSYAGFLAEVVTQRVNEEIIKQAVNASYAAPGVPEFEIPPELIARPTIAQVNNAAPTQPSVVTFAAPAVFALILQHMAVTLTALSFVRERLSGAMEMFRISPVNSFELVLGKYLGLGIVSAIVAATTALLLVLALGVPVLGDPVLIAGVVALLVFASLGMGLLISVIADSERQAVQLALLLLLASVFFSGFVLPINEFREGVQYAAYVLPVTHGIQLLQDLMLRGSTEAWWQLGALAVLGIVLLILTVIALRRTMRNA
jgi:ABC-2 type transport system permease protein